MKSSSTARISARWFGEPTSTRGRAWLRQGAVFSVVCGAVLLTGCPRGEGQGDVSTLPTITTTDADAEADLRAAQTAADEGSVDDAAARFRAFVEEHPDDPLVPLAQLGLGRVLLSNGEVEPALEQFDAVAATEDTRVSEAGKFYQGVAYQLSGRPEQAIEVLTPLIGRTTNPEDTELLLRTLSSAAQRVGRTGLALESLDRLARTEAIDAEARERAGADIATLVEAAEPEAIAEAYAALSQDGVAWPIVAVRAIRLVFDQGDMERVSEMVAALRARDLPLSDDLAELAVRAERTGRADPRVIGAIVPLTGSGRAVGQRTVRGLMLAADSPAGRPPGPDSPQLVLRDDAGDPERAAAAVEDLVSEHRAIAIVGPLRGDAARAAAERARELGIPLITLVGDPSLDGSSPLVFRGFPGPLDEARGLVAAAQARGARRFAVLRADHAYGQRMSEAFATAVSEAGLELVHTETYEASATAFGPAIAALAGQRYDALFIPDSASKLTLIAPALAAAGVWAARPGVDPPRGGRAVTLLAPSVAASATAGSSRRYLAGALFATPFDANAPGASSFLTDFQARFEQPPEVFAAHAYDAFRLIRAAVEAGETTRSGLARWLRENGRRETVTSHGGFDAEGTPAQPVSVREFDGERLSLPAPLDGPSSS
ncbi:MAG: penicillin-binding protein activator [Sandaracinaceae bacterium]